MRKRTFGLAPNVLVLGLVSLLTDVSSEITLTILPLYLTNVLGVGTPVVGLVEGIADSTSTLLKFLSGWLSDKIGKRKWLSVLGYSLSTIAKPFLYFATTWGLVLGVRFADRVGKGIRTAPRDALLADSSPDDEMGKSFGFHRAMDTTGAILGLAIAATVVFILQQRGLDLTRGTYQTLVLVGAVPAVIAVMLIVIFVQERRPAAAPGHSATKSSSKATEVQAGAKADFGAHFGAFIVVMMVFTLSNFSDAFLVLRAQDIGLSVFNIMLLLVTFNLVYAAVSLPAGILSDRIGRKSIIAAGWTIHGLIFLGFALGSATWQVSILLVLYGLYHGMTDGVLRAFVADMVPKKRGTAYGLYHGAVGLTAFPASVIAGVLWQAVSPVAPFFWGAAMALVAVLMLVLMVDERARTALGDRS